MPKVKTVDLTELKTWDPGYHDLKAKVRDNATFIPDSSFGNIVTYRVSGIMVPLTINSSNCTVVGWNEQDKRETALPTQAETGFKTFLKIIPNQSYDLDSLTIENASLDHPSRSADGSYIVSFTPELSVANVSLTITMKMKEYNITYGQFNNCTKDSSAPTKIFANSSVECNIEAQTGYTLRREDISVDGASFSIEQREPIYPRRYVLIISNPTKDVTVSVNAKRTYAIQFNNITDNHCYISGTTAIRSGETAVVTVTANSGYVVYANKLDRTGLDNKCDYSVVESLNHETLTITITNPRDDMRISVEAVLKSYNITYDLHNCGMEEYPSIIYANEEKTFQIIVNPPNIVEYRDINITGIVDFSYNFDDKILILRNARSDVRISIIAHPMGYRIEYNVTKCNQDINDPISIYDGQTAEIHITADEGYFLVDQYYNE